MAKNNSIFKLGGTLSGVVFVNGKYGSHVRVKRGTIKPATINGTLKANANRSAELNQLASPLYQLLIANAGINRDGGAWARILSRFRAVDSNNPFTLLQQLKGLNMHDKYPVSSVWNIPAVSINITPKQLLAYMRNGQHPHFTRLKEADAYRYQLTAFFRDDKTKKWQLDAVYTEWMTVADNDNAYDFIFDRPQGNGIYVLCIRLEAGLKGKPIARMEAIRTEILEVGEYS
jgi:hypothetical protein